MADLSTIATVIDRFYGMVGTTSSDDALVENGEAVDEVAYICLTQGFRRAQRFLVSHGMASRWRVRSSALSWSGADATDGGRYSTLPSDFMMFSQRPPRSSIVEANGEQWGQEVVAEHDNLTGDYYYLKNEQLWIAKNAEPPTACYLDYVFLHPEMAAATTMNFPLEVRPLCVAYAAQHGMAEGWFPRADGNAIERNVQLWEKDGALFARRSRAQRKQTAPKTVGTRFFA